MFHQSLLSGLSFCVVFVRQYPEPPSQLDHLPPRTPSLPGLSPSSLWIAPLDDRSSRAGFGEGVPVGTRPGTLGWTKSFTTMSHGDTGTQSSACITTCRVRPPNKKEQQSITHYLDTKMHTQPQVVKQITCLVWSSHSSCSEAVQSLSGRMDTLQIDMCTLRTGMAWFSPGVALALNPMLHML